MLNQSVASRIARVGAMSAYKPSADIPELTEGQAAARVGDGIKHKSFWAALAGAVVGALIAAAAIAVATMLFGGPFVLVASIVAVGAMATSYAASKTGHPGVAAAAGKIGSTVADVTLLGMGGVIEKASSAVTNFVDDMGSMDGKIITGVSGVIIEGKPAARAGVKLNDPDKPAPPAGPDDNLAEDVALNFSSAPMDTVECGDHPLKPPRIAEGSDSVFINGQPAARKGDKTECGAQIKQGASTVFIGVGTAQYLNVAEEFSWWQKAILIAVEFLVPPSRGFLKGMGKLFTRLGRRALLKGARIGALKAARAVRKMRVHPSCAAAAFKNNTGFKRFQESMKRFFKGDPIDVVTGEVFEQRTDIELGQTLPLRLNRTFVHPYEGNGLTGKNWADSFSEVAVLSAGGELVEIRCAEGCSLFFSLPSGYDLTVNPEHPDFTLARHPEGLALTDRRTDITRWFCPPEGRRDAEAYLLTRHEDRYGNTIRFIRDAEQRLVRVIHSDGPVLQLEWGNDGWLDAVNRTDNQLQDTLVSYRRNARGELTEADSRAFYHLYYDYTAEGRIARWHDNDKTWTRYEYDEQGRCSFSEAAEGFYTVRFHYAPGCTSVTDGKGHVTHYRYNTQNLVTETENPDGYITRFVYDDYGHLLSRISPAGRVETFEYLRDTGLVTAYTAPGGACWQYRWDEQQRLTSVTDPAGQVWHRQYDEQGSPVDFIAPDGSRTQLSYNSAGLLTTVEESEGARSVFQYDTNQRLHSVLDAEGRTLHLRYNRRDRLSSLSAGGGTPWRYEYDNHDRLLVNSRPDIRITYLWDGDVPAEEREYRNGTLWRVRRSYYNGFELLAQDERWREGEGDDETVWREEMRCAVSSPAGEPQALFSPDGECVWRRGEKTLWGVVLWPEGERDNRREPGLLYAGQQVDRESGLAYNRYRYYSAETGSYLTPDPIGLAGGLNQYAYVPNSLVYIDPFGLAVCNAPGGYKKGDVDLHGNLSPGVHRAGGHANNRTDGFIQSHHPIQDAWAKMRINGYSRNDAPAILLGSASGSPHAGISAAQRARRASSGGWNTTLKDEFNKGYEEMINAGVPVDQARKAFKDAYEYFDKLRALNKDNPFFNI